MAIVTESGSGDATSETVISVEDADTYFTARGTAAWTGDPTVKEQALRHGTEYARMKYSDSLQGVRSFEVQALDWPRTGVVAYGVSVGAAVIPVDVQRAVAELALRALTETLTPDLARSGGVTEESVKIPGAIEKSVKYAGAGTDQKAFVKADELMAPFMQDVDIAIRG